MKNSELKRKFNIKFGEIILVEASIRLPQVDGHSKSARRINAYYKAAMSHWERYVSKTLAKQAKKQYVFLTKRGFLFHTFDFVIDFTVTMNEGEVLSLYIDRGEYTGGANGTNVRNGDSWENGYPMHIKALESKKRRIQRQIIEKIKQRQTDGESYFEPVRKYVKKYYEPEQFYLTDKGVTVFYQETTIAPHSSGIVTFEEVLL